MLQFSAGGFALSSISEKKRVVCRLNSVKCTNGNAAVLDCLLSFNGHQHITWRIFCPKKLEWNLGALVIYVTFIPDSSHSEYPTNRNKSQMTTLNEGKTKPDATGFLLLLRNMVRYLKASPSLVFQWFAVLHNREGWVVIYRCQ